MNNRLLKAVAGCCLLLASDAVSAFATFGDGNGGVKKWGSNAPDTPGGELTWGFIPAGTFGSAFCGTACPGAALTSLQLEVSPGGGYSDISLISLQSYIEVAMAKWANVANISFAGPLVDGGLPINHPGSGTPDIRIGVFAFAPGFGGAVGYAPPPNGGTGSGDILFDANSFYGFQPGNDGDKFFPGGASTAPNDFESLLLHELGHALGLEHPAFDGSCPVMQVDRACLGKINRTLDADDIAGIQFLYGAPAPVPLPAAVWTFGAGLFGVLWLARKRGAA